MFGVRPAHLVANPSAVVRRLVAEHGALFELVGGGRSVVVGSQAYVLFRNIGPVDAAALACTQALKVSGNNLVVDQLRPSATVELVVLSGTPPQLTADELCLSVEDVEGVVLRPSTEAGVFIAEDANAAARICEPDWKMSLCAGASVLGFSQRWEVAFADGGAVAEAACFPALAAAPAPAPTAAPAQPASPIIRPPPVAHLSSSSVPQGLEALGAEPTWGEKPAPEPSDARRLLVPGLRPDVPFETLKDLLSAAGRLSVLALGPAVTLRSGASSCTAYIEYDKPDAAAAALSTLSGTLWMGAPLVLQPARSPISSTFPPRDVGKCPAYYASPESFKARRFLVIRGLPASTSAPALRTLADAAKGMTQIVLGPVVGGSRSAFAQFNTARQARMALLALDGLAFIEARLHAYFPPAELVAAHWPPPSEGPFLAADLGLVQPLPETADVPQMSEPTRRVVADAAGAMRSVTVEMPALTPASAPRRAVDDADEFSRRFKLGRVRETVTSQEIFDCLRTFGPLEMLAIGVPKGGQRMVYCLFRTRAATEAAQAAASSSRVVLGGESVREELTFGSSFGRPFPGSMIEFTAVDLREMEGGRYAATATSSGAATVSAPEDEACRLLLWLTDMSSKAAVSLSSLHEALMQFGPVVMLASSKKSKSSENTFYVTFKYASSAKRAVAATSVVANGLSFFTRAFSPVKWGAKPWPPPKAQVFAAMPKPRGGARPEPRVVTVIKPPAPGATSAQAVPPPPNWGQPPRYAADGGTAVVGGEGRPLPPPPHRPASGSDGTGARGGEAAASCGGGAGSKRRRSH